MPQYKKNQHSSGSDSAFSLIELAIVLVILGLLAGGVLVGQDLIRASEIRSITRDIDNYKAAVYVFQLKYNCLAGDCPNATNYFGAEDPNPTICETTASNGTLTCNGNGNRRVEDCSYEMVRFWQHLAIAGLIEGKYTGTGTYPPAGCLTHVLGVNAPKAAISGSGFGFSYSDHTGGGDGATYAINYGNLFWLGKQTTHRPQANLFTPKEAFAVDQKIDDGRPASGFVIMRSDGIGGSAWGEANACTTSTSATDFNGIYNISVTSTPCAFMIKSGL
jgi:prepilin-type N-terminal cleavage/methylation domain-containing protein